MWSYILRRILLSIPLIWAIITINFIIIHTAPGDPLAMYVMNPNISPEFKELMSKKLGLDKPLYMQYLIWLKNAISLDFGISFVHNRPVKDVLMDVIPNTIQLSALALIISFIIGIVIGTLSAIKQYSLWDHTSTFATLFIYSMPSFWLGLMLLLLFSLKLKLLPSYGMHSPNIISLEWWRLFFFWLDFPWWSSIIDWKPLIERSEVLLHCIREPHILWDHIAHLIMPLIVLGVGSAASDARYMRSSLLEVIRQDYIRTARAKGLSERTVIYKHALKNAFIPIITIMGLSLPFLLSGSVITETIFSWPGMGQIAINAIFSRDYPVIMAVNLIAAVMVIFGNLLADISYAILDPRIRYN